MRLYSDMQHRGFVSSRTKSPDLSKLSHNEEEEEGFETCSCTGHILNTRCLLGNLTNTNSEVWFEAHTGIKMDRGNGPLFSRADIENASHCTELKA